MSQPLLSILIPTTIERHEQWHILTTKINSHQSVKDGLVEEISDHAGKEMPIGEKREKMYKYANGLYSWQIDDDDDIAEDAIERILDIIKVANNPDCITFQELCFINGEQFTSNFSLRYDDWEGDGSRLLSDGFHYHRTPFFKCVIRTDIARSVPIPHIRFGEDHQWAQALKPHLQTEVHIPRNIYFYQHVSTNFNERYGIQNG